MRRFKNILAYVNLAFDEYSALARGVRLARHNNANLTAMTVIEEHPAQAHALLRSIHLEDALETIEREYREPFVQPVRDASLDVETFVAHGSTFIEISRAASKLKTRLVVLGARGLSGIQRFFLGSVSEKVAKYAPYPVLIGCAHGQMPDKISADEFEASGPLTLVVSSDGLAASDDAVRTIASLPPPASETSLFAVATVTHTHKTLLFEEPGMERMWQDERMAAEEVLGRSVSRLKECGCHEIRAYGERDPADEIPRAAEANNADLFAIGISGHSGIKRFLLGSVSDRVLRYAKCSV